VPETPSAQEKIRKPPTEKPLSAADRHFQQAATSYEAKDYAAAADALHRGLALEPNNAVQQAMLAMVLSYQEAWAESAEVYRKALQHQPDNALFHLGLAVALHRLERIDEAVSSLERAVALNPELEEAQQLLEVLTREPEGTLEKVWFTHNERVEGWEGVWIHTACTVKYWNKHQGLLRAAFFREDDRLIYGAFSNLVLANGQAAIEGPFSPPHRKSRYKDLHLFFPYKGLRLEEGDHRLKVQVDLVGPKGRVLATRWASLTLEVLKTASGVVEEARSSSVP
ncbi:MAG: tetratricopeptide repeat protein, partial [Nitrospinota bacterium]